MGGRGRFPSKELGAAMNRRSLLGRLAALPFVSAFAAHQNQAFYSGGYVPSDLMSSTPLKAAAEVTGPVITAPFRVVAANVAGILAPVGDPAVVRQMDDDGIFEPSPSRL